MLSVKRMENIHHSIDFVLIVISNTYNLLFYYLLTVSIKELANVIKQIKLQLFRSIDDNDLQNCKKYGCVYKRFSLILKTVNKPSTQ